MYIEADLSIPATLDIALGEVFAQYFDAMVPPPPLSSLPFAYSSASRFPLEHLAPFRSTWSESNAAEINEQKLHYKRLEAQQQQQQQQQQQLKVGGDPESTSVSTSTSTAASTSDSTVNITKENG